MAVVVSYYKNANATGSMRSQFGGPLAPLDDGSGWEWRFAGWVVDTANAGPKAAIEVRVETLNGDSLVQVNAKILAAVKASCAAQGYAITAALREASELVTSIP